MPKIKVNDFNIYYELYGQGEPLVLIPGFSVDHLLWGYILDYLSPYYQILIFDNRGSGQTDMPKGAYSIEQMAEDVIEICKCLGFEQAHFVGSSMGGYIAQMLAYRYPSKVLSAVFCNSAMSTDSPFHIYVAAQLELMQAGAPNASLIKAACAWAYSYQFLSQPQQLDKLIQLALGNPYPITIPGYESQYAAVKEFDSKSWANKITVPSLVISSEQDIILPPRLSQALQQKIAGSEYYCFQNCGHLPYIEYPEQFSVVIKNFISKHARLAGNAS